MHRLLRSLSLACLLLLLLLVSSAVYADTRINPPPYHFGGDALYCEQGAGCRLLNAAGDLLGTWEESAIAAALAAIDETGANTLVGDVNGTYGTASLWAVPTNETNGNKQLCLIAYDEWGKQNDMCFAVTTDGKYLPAPLALGEVEEGPDYCAPFSVGQYVFNGVIIGAGLIFGPITSIDPPNLTITNFGLGAPINQPFTAACSYFLNGIA